MADNWTTDAIPDLTGKVVVVTGANSGIGYDAALALAGKGAQVVVASRDAVKGRTALNQISTIQLDSAFNQRLQRLVRVCPYKPPPPSATIQLFIPFDHSTNQPTLNFTQPSSERTRQVGASSPS